MAYFIEKMSVSSLKDAMTKTKTVIIPVGVVEQHGFHLPLSTDILNATMPLKLAGERLNAVVAPAVNYCFSGGELLGTVNVTPNVFGLYITDICKEFIRMGFINVVILLGHAGTENRMALESSLQMYLRSGNTNPNAAVSLVPVWDLSPTWMACFNMQPEHDFHAGLAETSLMKYWAPELVGDEITMDDEYTSRMMRSDQDWFEKREKAYDHPYVVAKVGQRDEISVGVMGFPEKAGKEMGEKIANEIIDSLVDYVEELNGR
jgi:creatinine amidohydrolase